LTEYAYVQEESYTTTALLLKRGWTGTWLYSWTDRWIGDPSLSFYARRGGRTLRLLLDSLVMMDVALFVGLQGANSPMPTASASSCSSGPPLPGLRARAEASQRGTAGARWHVAGATRVMNSDPQLICPGPVWGCIASHRIAWAHGWVTVPVNRALVGNSLPCRRRPPSPLRASWARARAHTHAERVALVAVAGCCRRPESARWMG
jgi:hypothetical protein